jgi:hypothetical protein
VRLERSAAASSNPLKLFKKMNVTNINVRVVKP